MFSLDIDAHQPGRGRRRLPTFYFGNSPIFASRDADVVASHLVAGVRAVAAAPHEPIYALTACTIDGRTGLYGREIFNRAPYRRRLERLGMRFADDSYVRFRRDGRFASGSSGSFSPDFIVLHSANENPGGVVEARGASLAFSVATARLGRPDARELGHLSTVLEGVTALGAPSPAVLIDALRAGRRRAAR